MISFTREQLARYARRKTPGFEAEALRRAIEVDGLLTFHPETMAELRAQFRPERRGLGDWVEAAVKPAAKALKLDCLDPQTGALKPESKCAERKRWLNGLTSRRI